MTYHYIVGIDYSLTSPSITIYNTQTHSYNFISLFDISTTKDWTTSKRYTTHQSLSKCVKLIPYTRYTCIIPNTPTTPNDYIISQQLKVKDAVNISNIIIDNLDYYINSQPVIIGIEGFSYNSHSSSYIDLIMYQSILRESICNTFGFNTLYVVSPTDIKKTLSGKGNADKNMMIKSFIDNRLNDNDLIESDLYNTLCNLHIDKNHIKPIDDLVDSYGVVRTVLKHLKHIKDK